MEPAKFGALFLVGMLFVVVILNPTLGLLVAVLAFPVWLLLARLLLDRNTDWNVKDDDWYNEGGHGKV